MSFPQFTATRKLADSSDSKTVASAVNALAANLLSIFTSLLGRVQLDSVLLPGVQLTPGFNTVPHTLGRTLTGWRVTRLNAAAVLYDAQATSPDQGTYLVLVSNTTCTVSLEVF